MLLKHPKHIQVQWFYKANLVSNPAAEERAPKGSEVVDRVDASLKGGVRNNRHVPISGGVHSVAESYDINLRLCIVHTAHNTLVLIEK